jgi:CRISPR-associated protein Cas2
VFVILVYDTAAERNPHVLKTCRQYLNWTQRSVFQGELTAAQYRALMSTLGTVIDTDYDSIVTYTARSPDFIATSTLGVSLGGPGDII